MNEPIVVRVRQHTQGRTGGATVAWALVMALSLFAYSARWHVEVFAVLATFATVALAALLGWQRRLGTAVVAPFLSWVFAWFPMLVGSVLHRGFFKGVLVGTVSITIGWLFIGMCEFLALVAVGLPFRIVSGLRSEPEVIIEAPERHWS